MIENMVIRKKRSIYYIFLKFFFFLIRNVINSTLFIKKLGQF
jgi:hypothetical protein